MTLPSNNSERRSSPRIVAGKGDAVAVSFVENGVHRTITAVKVNVGETGLGLEVRELVPAGISVTVGMAQDGVAVVRGGRVRWIFHKVAGKGGSISIYNLGIELDHTPSVNDRRFSGDRRRPGPWFNRRNTNRRTKEFVLDHYVFLSDTNLVGNTYFAKHFEWQGHVREAFLFHVVDFPSFVKLGIKLITKEASCEYMSESTLGDPVVLTLRVGKVTFARLELLFSFVHKVTQRIISRGRQVIVFGGPNGKPVGIPEMILKGIAPFR